jgi:16S rRNA (guanine966-N2)-methyltransferase
VADKPGLRPTPDRVRETLFNWLGQDLTGWRCLDAFAGSGALGFEAASRGAAQVVLLERDPELARSLKASQQRLGAAGCASRTPTLWPGWRAARPAASTWCCSTRLSTPGCWQPALAQALRLVPEGGFVYLEDGQPLPEPPLGVQAFRSAALVQCTMVFGAAATLPPTTDEGPRRDPIQAADRRVPGHLRPDDARP